MMIDISEKDLDEFIAISNKEGVKYKDRADARQSASNLVGFFDVLITIDQQEKERKKRLKDEPKGFTFLGEGRSCSLCSRSVTGDMWYDKWGQQCLDCHEAYAKRIVPGYVFGDYKCIRSVTSTTLQYKFGISHMTLKKLVRQGKLKARIIPGNDIMVFLRKENSEIVSIIEEVKKIRNLKKK